MSAAREQTGGEQPNSAHECCQPSHLSEFRRASSERNCARSTERLREPRQHYEVSVEGDAFQTSDAEPVQSVVVLQAPELALHRNLAPVEASLYSEKIGASR